MKKRMIMEQLTKVELTGIVGCVAFSKIKKAMLARLTLATDTAWHNVTVWEGSCQPYIRAIKKGSKLHVLGRMHCQEYTDSEGKEHKVSEIFANKVNVLYH